MSKPFAKASANFQLRTLFLFFWSEVIESTTKHTNTRVSRYNCWTLLSCLAGNAPFFDDLIVYVRY